MKLIVKIVASLFLGSAVTLFLLQEDERFKESLHGKLKSLFEQMFACNVSYTLKRVNFFQGRLEAEDVCVQASDGSWSWKTHDFRLDLSLLSLFSLGKLGLEIAINDLQAQSLLVDGVPAINDHIKKLILEASDVPCTLKNLTIPKGTLSVADSQKVVEGSLSFSNEMALSRHRLKNNLYITDAQLSIWDIPCLSNMYLHVALEKSEAHGLSIKGDGKVTFELFDEHEKNCYLNAFYDGDQATVTLHNKHHSLKSDVRLMADKKCQITSKFPISVLNKLLYFIGPSFSGFCTSSLTIDFAKQLELRGTLAVENALYESVPLGTIKTSFEKIKENWQGTLLFDHKESGAMEGSWQWHERLGRGLVDVVNTTTLQSKMTYWYVKPHDAHIKCILERNRPTTGFYTLSATHNILNSQVTTKGNFLHHDVFKAQGTVGKNKYALTMDLVPQFFLKSFLYHDFHDQRLFSIATDAHNAKDMHICINYHFIRNLLKDF